MIIANIGLSMTANFIIVQFSYANGYCIQMDKLVHYTAVTHEYNPGRPPQHSRQTLLRRLENDSTTSITI